MSDLKWEEFERVDFRVGTIINAEIFEKAIQPALKLEIDFGASIGVKKSSAQITDHYDPSDIIGKQVCAVINFPRKQIGPFYSECLVTGFIQDDGTVILAVPDKKVKNGLKLA